MATRACTSRDPSCQRRCSSEASRCKGPGTPRLPWLSSPASSVWRRVLTALLRLGELRVLPDAGERLGAVLGLFVGGDEAAVSQEGEEPLALVPVVFDGFRKV